MPNPTSEVVTVTIGTAADCTLRINDDPYVSNHHARITRGADGVFRIEDLGSTNGTTLNGSRIYGPTVLPLVATIEIGRTTVPWQRPS